MQSILLRFESITKKWNKLSLLLRTIYIVPLIILCIGVGIWLLTRKTNIQYKTEKVTRGTLIVTVTGSGQVSTANNATVSTYATGVVSKIYVKDGDEVRAGDKIAEVDLDLLGKQNEQQSFANYQSAQNSLEAARANMYSLQSTMFSYWDTFMKIAQNGTYQYEDGQPNNVNRALPEFHIANDNWLAAEAKYKAQQNVINQAQTALTAAWILYQQNSPIIYAPISGTISGFSLQIGSVIAASSNTTNNAQSATKIASIRTKAFPMVSINVTEIDIPKIKLGNKATVFFDAFPDKTFTGEVVSIDLSGIVSSGVTTYPIVIRLDNESTFILPNMAALAHIIIATKTDVLLVPSTSIQKKIDGTYFIRILKNGKPVQIDVETGLSSDTQTEIVQGVSEGDIIITGITSSNQSQKRSSQFQSIFGTFSGGRALFGGGR